MPVAIAHSRFLRLVWEAADALTHQESATIKMENMVSAIGKAEENKYMRREFPLILSLSTTTVSVEDERPSLLEVVFNEAKLGDDGGWIVPSVTGPEDVIRSRDEVMTDLTAEIRTPYANHFIDLIHGCAPERECDLICVAGTFTFGKPTTKPERDPDLTELSDDEVKEIVEENKEEEDREQDDA